jgi:hypothetical protein
MNPAMPKVGDIAFRQAWGDTECRAVVTEADNFETFARVDVLVDGELVWSSPRVELNDDDWAFGNWSDGSGVPCLFDDVDGDGRPEMLALVPKADLSPTVFRVFAWNGRELILSRKASLLRDKRGRFVWTQADPEEIAQVVWVDYFQDGQAEVVHRRRATTSRRSVKLKPVAAGFAEVS